MGFLAGTASTGKRRSRGDDVCVLLSETTAATAGIFTRNQMAAPPIAQAKAAMADGELRAVVVNAGNANACTGVQGAADAASMAECAAGVLGVPVGDVAVASTGVIGVPLDRDTLLPAVASAAKQASHDGGGGAAKAIMTTDTFSKEAVAVCEAAGTSYTVGGMAKGAGMIRPDMATMLCFVTTDAPLDAPACRAILADTANESFDRITVDGETSTNDCVILMANGAAGGDPIGVDHPALDVVRDAVAAVMTDLARQIVRDGEGATTFIEIFVSGAASDDEAHEAAMAVADSLLFKCAVFGRDPNWGRVVRAVGASSARVDPETIAVSFAGVEVASGGMAVPFDEEEAVDALDADEIVVAVDLGIGDGEAVVWTCDLSFDYVRINAEYRT
jgi:glutamate N-acetyltransferase/amino-acid N-acetyltransferase